MDFYKSDPFYSGNILAGISTKLEIAWNQESSGISLA
jgi:hypothetical protein